MLSPIEIRPKELMSKLLQIAVDLEAIKTMQLRTMKEQQPTAKEIKSQFPNARL